jgi:membrane protease subunit HflC
MKNHIWIFLVAVLVLLALLASTVMFTVQYTDDAIVKTFGSVSRVLRGNTDSGLHVKWPWPIERVTTYDARTQVFDGVEGQIQTSDGQTVVVSMFVAWRIDDPQKFQQNFGSTDAANPRLESMLVTYQKEVIASNAMGRLINTDKDEMRMAEIENKVQALLAPQAMASYGVKVERVGLRRLDLPSTVSAAVIDAMKAERERLAKSLEAAGEAQAIAIRQRARTAASVIEQFAHRKAQSIRAEGDAAAAEYYAKFEESPELAMFLRSLESLRRELKSRTVILLDGTQVPGVSYFSEGPKIPAAPETVTEAADPAATAEPATN